MSKHQTPQSQTRRPTRPHSDNLVSDTKLPLADRMVSDTKLPLADRMVSDTKLLGLGMGLSGLGGRANGVGNCNKVWGTVWLVGELDRLSGWG
jgi:hypothetical protein